MNYYTCALFCILSGGSLKDPWLKSMFLPMQSYIYMYRSYLMYTAV